MAAVEPVATLGGELPADALTKEDKKKQKKKQQKVSSRASSVCNTQMSFAFTGAVTARKLSGILIQNLVKSTHTGMDRHAATRQWIPQIHLH